jgi:hypothetical protein
VYTDRKWSDVVGYSSSEGEMEGGVRTAKGQAWAFRKLQQRADQIQDIKDDPERFTAYEAPEFAALKEEALASQGVAEVAGPRLYLELAGLLNMITSSIQTGNYNKVVLGDLFKMLKILFRVGASANREELGDLLAVVNENLEALRGINASEEGRNPIVQTLAILLGQTHEYLTKMLGAVDKTPKERKVASRSAIKTLQFTRPLGRVDTTTGRTKFGPKDRREAAERQAVRIPNLITAIMRRKKQDQAKLRIANRRLVIAKNALMVYQTAIDTVNEIEALGGPYSRARRARATELADARGILARDAARRREGRTREERAPLTEVVATAEANVDGLERAIASYDKQIAVERSRLERSGERILPTIESSEATTFGSGNPVTTGGSARIRSQLAARLAEPEVIPNGVRLNKDTRSTWAARSGAYYGESLPGYPDAFVSRSGKRAPKEAGLPTTAPVQATPVFSNKK